MQLLRLLILSLLLVFGACTNANKHQVDADGFFGRKPRNFFFVESSTKTIVVSVLTDPNEAKKYIYHVDTGFTELGDIPFDSITFSSDGRYLTIKGAPQVFEIHEIAKEEIPSIPLSTVQTTVESLCVGNPQGSSIGQTTYQEVQMRVSSGVVTVVALGNNKVDTLGMTTRTDTPLETIFAVAGFGQFKIDLTSPLSTDSQYFRTTVTHAEWFSSTNLYCHLNRNQVILVPEPQHVTSNAAVLAGSVEGDGATWDLAMYAQTKDGLSARFGPDYGSDFLQMNGYFAISKPLPGNATIDGIRVNCLWRGFPSGTQVRDSNVQLLKNGVAVGQNKALNSLLPFSTLTLSGDYGGPTDLWGTTWTVADIHDTAFGVQVAMFSGNDHSRGEVDYCEVKVYWH